MYVPKVRKTCPHIGFKRGNQKGMEGAWDGQCDVCGRSEHAIRIRHKDGSTDEIAIDETRLLQSRKAFARRRQRHNSKEKEPRMASERTETGDKEDRWRQREEGDVCHRQTAGKETDKEGAGYEGYG